MVDCRSLRIVTWLALLASIALLVVCSSSASAQIIYQNDFEDDPVGTYTVSNLAADWNGVTSNDGVDEGRVSIADDADALGKSLVVMYPEGESNNGKSQWRAPLNGSYDELYLSYKIRFDENFNFVRGGKLPGLCGGACNSGGSQPNGTDGWSGRMMWRTAPSGGSSLPPHRANIVQYVYHKDQTANGGVNGDDLKWDDTTPTDWKIFDSDVWYQLQHRIVMNTPGQDDGIVQAWLDGEMVLDVQNIHFRDTTALKIDTLYFSTFFGGSSSVWETTKDEYAYYDDFIVSTQFINTSPFSADFDGDYKVDGTDLGMWETAYNSNAGGDADGDLESSGLDFLLWQQQHTGSAASLSAAIAAVPEPATVLLLGGLGPMALLMRPRRA